MKKKLHYAKYVFWALPLLGLNSQQLQAESRSAEVPESILNYDSYRPESSINAFLNARLSENALSDKMLKRDLALNPVEVTVKGRVTDEEGDGLPGVTVRVQGTSRGTATDINGNYTISVPDENATLVFSFVGYVTQTIEVGNRTTINVDMKSDIEALEEVVVVGYGTVKKRDVTGAVSSVSEGEIKEVPVQNITQAMQGRVAGVDIAAGSFRPGAVPNIRIRGNRSVRASNEPLYVVDGIPLAAGGINDFNQLDVESIEVLKDASSTAIYGSRGANGVILITTKRGKKGPFNVNYDTYVSLDRPLRTLDLFDGPGFAELRREAFRNTNTYRSPFPDPKLDYNLFRQDPYMWESVAMGYEWEDRENRVPKMRPATPEEQEMWGVDEVPIYNPENVRSTNWQDMGWRNAVTQSHQLVISGGNENTRVAFSGSYLNQEGLQPGEDFTRYNARLSLDTDVTDFLKIGASINASLTKENIGADLYWKMVGQLPLAVPYDDEGNIIQLPGGDINIFNPIRDPELIVNEIRTSRFFGSFYAEAQLLEGLKYRMNLGPDIRNRRGGRFFGGETSNRQGGSSLAGKDHEERFSYVLENLLFYDKDLGEDHHIGLTFLQSMQRDRFESVWLEAQDLPYDTQLWHNLGSTDMGAPTRFGSHFSESSLMSWMGRANYSFKDRYLLTATGRFDGSSVLAPGNKWDFFPSVALAWKMQEEGFMQNLGMIDEMKLRASYGTVGQSSIPPYLTAGPLYRTFYAWGQEPASGFRPGSQPLPDLRWERTSTLNLGLDFGLFERVYGTVEVYQANTSNLILPRAVPTASGYWDVLQNIGATRNTGIELSLTTDNIRSLSRDGFNWSTDFVFTKNKEEFVELYHGAQDDVGNRWFIGQPLGVYYDYNFEGIWQEDERDQATIYDQVPGDIKVTDVDNNDIINQQDMMVLGSRVPRWTGSINNTFRYKGFTLSAMVYARVGHMVHNNYYRPGLGGRYQGIAFPYYTPENPSNEFPRPIRDMDIQQFGSALAFQDGTFVKVRNISLNYDFPEALASRIHANNLSIYVNAVNPFLFTDFMVLDPEVSDGGHNFSAKSLVFGLRVGF